MSHMIKLSLDDLGQIIIPNSLRSRLGLSPGMTLVVEKGDKGGLRLRIESQPATSVLVEKKGLLVARVQPLTDLTNITRFERDCNAERKRFSAGVS